MPDVQFTNLLGVLGVALVAPLALGFLPRVRVPAVVLEILLGVVAGPSVASASRTATGFGRGRARPNR